MPNEEIVQKNLELQVYQKKQLKKIRKVSNHVRLGLLIISSLNKGVMHLAAVAQTIPYLNLVFGIAKCLLNLCTLWFGPGSFKHKLMKAAGNLFSMVVSVVLLGVAAIVGTIVGLTMYSLRFIADSIAVISVIKNYVVGNWHKEQEACDKNKLLLAQKISEYVQLPETSISVQTKHSELTALNNQIYQEEKILRKDKSVLAHKLNKVLIDVAYISGFILTLFPPTLLIGITILSVVGAYQLTCKDDPLGAVSRLEHTLFGLQPKPQRDLDKMIADAKSKLKPAFSPSTGLIQAAMPGVPLRVIPSVNHEIELMVFKPRLFNKRTIIVDNEISQKNNGIIRNNTCRVS